MPEIEFGLRDSDRAEAWLQATLTMRTLGGNPLTEDEAAQFRARMRFAWPRSVGGCEVTLTNEPC